MSIKINKPSDSLNQKPTLSKMGKLILITLGVVLCIVIWVSLRANATHKVTTQKETNLLNAINRSISVCENSLQILEVDQTILDKFNQFKLSIEKEKKVLQKKDLALEMIGFTLAQAKDNHNVTVELNGTRNRIFVAFKEYNTK